MSVHSVKKVEKIPAPWLKYTVAVGNLILLIFWSIFGFVLSLYFVKYLVDKSAVKHELWSFVKAGPIAFCMMLVKFFGVWGALAENVPFLLTHIILSTIYLTFIIFALIGYFALDSDFAYNPRWYEIFFAIIHHLANLILFFLAIYLIIEIKRKEAGEVEEVGSEENLTGIVSDDDYKSPTPNRNSTASNTKPSLSPTAASSNPTLNRLVRRPQTSGPTQRTPSPAGAPKTKEVVKITKVIKHIVKK